MTDTDRQLTSEPGEWLSILDAAGRLKIRDRSVRRMVSEGRLLRRLRQGKAEVWIPESLTAGDGADDPPDAGQGTSSDNTLPAPDDTGRALAIIGQQRAMIEWLNEQAKEQQAPLLAMIDARDETIRALERDKAQLAAELEAANARQVTSTDAPAARAHWWRRWFAL
jgi:hypothetical protein